MELVIKRPRMTDQRRTKLRNIFITTVEGNKVTVYPEEGGQETIELEREISSVDIYPTETVIRL